MNDDSVKVGHLTISRRVGEKVVISGNITVEVAEVLGRSRVKLVITAPESVSIHRLETLKDRE